MINLSGDKFKVLSEIWRALKIGGELFFSDIIADRRIPEEMKKNHPELWGEGLSGAYYIEDFRRLMKSVGFNTFFITK